MSQNSAKQLLQRMILALDADDDVLYWEAFEELLARHEKAMNEVAAVESFLPHTILKKESKS